MDDVPKSLGILWILAYLVIHFLWQFVPLNFFILRVFFLAAVAGYLIFKGVGKDVLIYFFGPNKDPKSLLSTFLVFIIPLLILRVISRGYFSGIIEPSFVNILNEAIIPPVNEEIVFRALFLSILIVQFKGKAFFPIVLSTFIFVIIHNGIGVPGIINLSVSGALYGLAYLRSGSVFVPIVLHMIWNGLSFLPPLFQFS